MSNPNRLNSLFVTPDTNARYRLKSATTILPEFGDTLSCATFGEAHKILAQGNSDILFISSRLPQEDLNLFLKESQQAREEHGIAVVLILPESQNSGATVSRNLIGGVDGVLTEPFSAESLCETAKTAEGVKAKYRGPRGGAVVWAS